MTAGDSGAAARPVISVSVLAALLLLVFLWPLLSPLPGGYLALGALFAVLAAAWLAPASWRAGLARWFRGSELAQRGALMIAALVVTLGGLEYLARGLAATGLAEPYSAMRTMLPEGVEDWRMAHLTADRHRQPDPELLWRPVDRAPYNRQRFKGPVIAADKPTGTFRIFCYGDSNTDGPDQGGWAELLGQRLAARGDGRTYEVVNAGVTGYSSHQGLLRLRRDARRYRPDLVLVSFGWNDLAPALGAPDSSFRPPAAPIIAAQRLLLRYDFFLLARRYWPRGAPPAATGPRVSRAAYGANLAAFIDTAAEVGGRVALLTRPHREPEPALTGRRDDWRREVPAYNRIVRRQVGRNGAVLIDAQRRFAGRPELFVDECHFNAAGHERMAEVVEGRLAARGLLGNRPAAQEETGPAARATGPEESSG